MIVRRARALLPAAAAGAVAGCAGIQSALEPAGPAAARIATLWWLMLAATLIPAIGVIALALYAVRRARSGRGAGLGVRDDVFVLTGGAAIPLVILVALLLANVRTGARVARPPGPPELTIDVTGHQYWWEVRYPEHDVVTANEIRLPVGVPVRVRVGASDVIHSFWVPRLHGKLDMIPGRTNVTWLQASEPGVFRGQCAEFCGLQHALMAFLVVAEPPERFAAWLAARRRGPAPVEEPAAVRGREVFVEAACAHCHAVRGMPTPARTGSPGPDLTDLAARRTLAAATVPNDPGTLAAWILDPHRIKPGARMPPTPLSAADLDALLAYLGTLR